MNALILTLLIGLFPQAASAHSAPQTVPKPTLKEVCGTFDDDHSDHPVFRKCLILRPDGTFTYTSTTDYTEPYKATGTFTFVKGVVHLTILTPKQKGRYDMPPSTDNIPILWGERLYITPLEYKLAFCNVVNSGEEPRTRRFGGPMLRQGDENKPAPGFPLVPPKWRPYLLTKPVTAQIMALKRTRRRPYSRGSDHYIDTVEVTVAAGAKQGLKVGMELYILHADEVIIRRVSETQCIAEFELYAYDATGSIGLEASTRSPTHEARN